MQADCISECVRFSESLRILYILSSLADSSKISLSGKSLACLSACKQLRHLCIRGSITLAADDLIIRQIFSNSGWTNLQVLRLPYSVEGNSPSILSLNTIATNCPNLMVLGICADLRLHKYESLKANWNRGSRLEHKLKQLDLLPLPLTVAEAANIRTTEMAIGVSRYIEYHFPHLKMASLFLKVRSPADIAWWEGVRTLLSEYRAIREEMQESEIRTSTGLRQVLGLELTI